MLTSQKTSNPKNGGATSASLTPDLAPFSRRIRLLRAWRLAGWGMVAGAAVSVALAVLDYAGVRFVEAWHLVVPIALGALAGIVRAVTERLPADVVARSVDRRADLSDRLTTATAFAGTDAPLALAMATDATSSAASVRARKLYPIRFGRLQAGAAGLSALSVAVFLLANTSFLKPAQAKQDAAFLKKAAEKIERASKPILEAAKEAEATEEEKRLARELKRFEQQLNKGRINKPEALIKANELTEQARKLEGQRQQNLQQAVQKAQTAGDQLQKMSQQNKAQKMSKSDQMRQMMQQAMMQKPGQQSAQQMQQNAAKMQQMKSENAQQMRENARQMQQTQSEMEKTENEIKKLEEALKNNKDPKTGKPMTREQSEAMKKKIAELQEQLKKLAERLKDLKLSKEAMETFQKLMESPEFKEAQEILQKLAQKLQEQQAQQQAQQMAETGEMPDQKQPGEGDVPKLTEKELKEMEQALREQAEKMEELAKELKDPAKMKAYAQAMLEAAKAAKELGQCNGLGMGLGAPFGLPGMPSMGGGMHGPGGPGSQQWMGPQGRLSKNQNSDLLKNTKFKDEQITSQIGDNGPETYIEVTGPAQMNKASAVPYRNVLPKYEKSAESALNKGEIPARLKGKVRNYFDSLRR